MSDDGRNKSEWGQHPHTAELVAKLRSKRTLALEALVRAAASSSDPKVMLAHSVYLAMGAQIHLLEKGEPYG